MKIFSSQSPCPAPLLLSYYEPPPNVEEGDYTLSFEFQFTDPNGNSSSATGTGDVQVLPHRQVTVTTDLPQQLTLVHATSVAAGLFALRYASARRRRTPGFTAERIET
jgi:hypothetical protein